MAAHEHLSDIQFVVKHHLASETGLSTSLHRVTAMQGERQVGTMSWRRGKIDNIEVDPEFQRKGIATELWNRGHQEAAANRSVAKPTHSPDRTDAGDAWAKSVGGRLPRRS